MNFADLFSCAEECLDAPLPWSQDSKRFILETLVKFDGRVNMLSLFLTNTPSQEVNMTLTNQYRKCMYRMPLQTAFKPSDLVKLHWKKNADLSECLVESKDLDTCRYSFTKLNGLEIVLGSVVIPQCSDISFDITLSVSQKSLQILSVSNTEMDLCGCKITCNVNQLNQIHVL